MRFEVRLWPRKIVAVAEEDLDRPPQAEATHALPSLQTWVLAASLLLVGLSAGALPGRRELDAATVAAGVPTGAEVTAAGRFWLVSRDSAVTVLDRFGGSISPRRLSNRSRMPGRHVIFQAIES